MELAGVLHALGSAVSLITLEEKLLDVFDPVISDTLTEQMIADGIELHPAFQVCALGREAAGIAVQGVNGKVLEGFDCVIWASQVATRP